MWSILYLLFVFTFLTPSVCHAYIDPGTGSMLFTILIGIIGALNYVLRMAWIKFRFVLKGGKQSGQNSDKLPFVIFTDSKRYWNIFEPICREFDKRGIDINYLTMSPDDPALTCKYDHVKAEFIGDDNKAFMKMNYLNANIVLSTTPSLDVYQWKRSPGVDYYVHTFHACGDVLLYRCFGIDYYDSILLQGKFQEKDIRDLEALRNLPAKELHMVGVPYMDEMVKRLKESDPIEKNEKIVLLAPSWGPSGILTKLGGTFIEKLLATGYHVIVRPHPQSFVSEKELMDKLMKLYPASERLEWNRDNDNFDVLRKSDILISDFSGVIFDFALVYDKPIIYTDTKFETDVYDAWWLNRPLWFEGALPRIGSKLTEENMDSIKECIDSCIDSPVYAKGRDELREETWQCYGYGATKTVDYLLAKYEELINKETAK